MTPPIVISDLRFTASDAASAATGRIYLSLSRSRRSNRESCTHFAFRPTSDDSRLALEIAIFAVLRPRPETAAS